MNYSLEQFPDYKAAREKRDDLMRAFGAAQEQEQKIQAGLSHRAHSQVSEITKEAEALLIGNPADVEISKLRDEHVAARRKVEVLAQACKMQQEIVETARGRVSGEICKLVKSEHGALVLKVTMAVKELSVAIEAQQRFRDSLEQRGVNTSHLPHPRHPDIGWLSDTNSFASMCVKFGGLT